MQIPEAIPQLPNSITAGDVVVALSVGAGTNAATWIKLSPRGEITTRNGVTYHFDPEALAARFVRDDVMVAIDFDHGIAKLASKGERVDAIGWIEEMQARADGLYGRVAWLDTGKAALAAKTHRYVSPTFHHDEAGRATWMHSVALVTAPALSGMPALASADPQSTTETTMSKKIAAALGLADAADEAACLAAIAALKAAPATAASTPPEGFVTKSVHDTTLATLSATTQELDGLKKADRKAKVDGVLEGALKAKKILPAQREHYASLCASDDGLAQVTALLAATPEGLKPSGLDGRAPETGSPDGDAIDAATLAADARALVTASERDGTPITIQAAVAQVRAKKKGAA